MATLIIVKGHDRGREIHVPKAGVRVGRSHANDVVIPDDAVSQFHCRFFFKSDKSLWVTDFASTNETRVNDQPITEARLSKGDEVEVGDCVFRVVRASFGTPGIFDEAAKLQDVPVAAESDSRPEPSGERAAAAAGPAKNDPPRASDDLSDPSPVSFDLGFGSTPAKQPPPKRERTPSPGIRWQRIVVASVLLLGVLGLAWWGVSRETVERDASSRGMAAETASMLLVQYEKVEAGPENIFRYSMRIENGVIHIQIDDVKNQRHVSREKQLDPVALETLRDLLQESVLPRLLPEYVGVSPGVYNVYDVAVVVGVRASRVRVLNRVEPDDFRQIRLALEDFGQAELGLAALAMNPDRLRAMAREAFLEGRKRFEEREVRYSNLSESIRQFKLVEWYLETIEPKPDFYGAALQERERAQRLLEERYNDIWFRAERAVTLRDWEEAARNLRVIIELIPDRRDERHQRAETRLLAVERHLRR